jgi:NitT/TauT family transport system substrate-binding protein
MKAFSRLTLRVLLPLIVVVFTAVIIPAPGPAFSAETPRGTQASSAPIKFGVLPVIQALPVFVAAEKGFFKEAGLDVELVTFNSALDKDVAFTSNQIAGYFGDLQTCIVLNGNNAPIKIVAEVYNATKPKSRTFVLLISPKYSGKSLREAVRAGVAVSSNTILDYLTTKFLTSKNIPLGEAHLVEMKNIPIRMQMLLGGQVPAAVLPEPLATLAESRGAQPLMDDAGTGLSSTVLAFNEAFLSAAPDRAKAFLRAVDKASGYINANRDAVRPTMNRECRIPDELKKNFPVPEFPKLSVPSREHVNDVYQWLSGKNTIRRTLTYRQMVSEGYVL